MKKLAWIVEIEIGENWVADGFVITPDVIRQMLREVMPEVYDDEIGATVMIEPSTVEVCRLQQQADAQG